MLTPEQKTEASDAVLDIKHCVDCRHYIPDASLGENYGRCRRRPEAEGPTSDFINWMVTGKGEKPKDRNYYFCSVERGLAGTSGCGIDAKFFEAKPTQPANQTKE